jgi:hypothetical protein
MQKLINIIKDCAKESGAAFSTEFTGNGMNDKTCCAIFGDFSKAIKVISEVINTLHYQKDCEYYNFGYNTNLLLNFCQEDRGLKQIVYWPSLIYQAAKEI